MDGSRWIFAAIVTMSPILVAAAKASDISFFPDVETPGLGRMKRKATEFSTPNSMTPHDNDDTDLTQQRLDVLYNMIQQLNLTMETIKEKVAVGIANLKENMDIGFKNQSSDISELRLKLEEIKKIRDERYTDDVVHLSSTTFQAAGPPQIVEHPEDQKVRVGSIATFYCRVIGNPPLKIHWLKCGKKISATHSRIRIQNIDGVSILRIDPTRQFRDDCSYECTAENGIGDPVTASASLTVLSEGDTPPGFPVIFEQPITKVVEKEKTVNLTCNYSGLEPLSIVWLKDLLPIQPGVRATISGDRGETLQITNASEADAGNYECVVGNQLGFETSQTAKIYVKERRVPPEILMSTKSLYQVWQGENLNLTCVAIGSPLPTISWRKGTEDLTPYAENGMPHKNNILSLKNIQETAVYTCVATNKLGIKEINTLVKVISLPNPPTIIRVSDITAFSVRLTWSYEPDKLEEVTFYLIQYKPKDSNDSYTEISGIINQDRVVSLLQPYTEYEFKITAFNQFGRGIPSAPVEATTAEARPQSAPRYVNARPLSSSQMLVNWEEPETANGQITGYKVYYTANPTLPLSEWNSKKVDGDNEMTTIHDLAARTIYTIRVQAYTSMGAGPVSNGIQAKSEQGIPGQPRNFRASLVLPTIVQLKWNKPNYIGDSITAYELYWNNTSSTGINHVHVGNMESFNLTALQTNTTYIIWLAAKTRKGEGPSTLPISVHTRQKTLPNPPQKIQVSDSTDTSVKLKWSYEQNQQVDVSYYIIQYKSKKPNQDYAEISGINNQERIITSLTPNTKYEFRVVAFNQLGRGNPSTVIEGSTQQS